MRVLRVARSSAPSSRTQAINQMRSLVSTAPDELRSQLRDLSVPLLLQLTLRHIVLTRMVNDPRTKHYVERRMKEGRTKKEAIRCLKRYVAREVRPASEVIDHP